MRIIFSGAQKYRKVAARAGTFRPFRRVRLPRELVARKARSFSSWNRRSRHRTDTAGYLLESSSGGIDACKLKAESLAFPTSVRGFVEQIRRLLIDIPIDMLVNVSIYNFYLNMKINIEKNRY